MAKNFDNPWDALTEKQKRRIKLRMRGFSYAEIGRQEGVTKQAVHKSLSTPRKYISGLRAML